MKWDPTYINPMPCSEKLNYIIKNNTQESGTNMVHPNTNLEYSEPREGWEHRTTLIFFLKDWPLYVLNMPVHNPAQIWCYRKMPLMPYSPHHPKLILNKSTTIVYPIFLWVYMEKIYLYQRHAHTHTQRWKYIFGPQNSFWLSNLLQFSPSYYKNVVIWVST